MCFLFFDPKLLKSNLLLVNCYLHCVNNLIIIKPESIMLYNYFYMYYICWYQMDYITMNVDEMLFWECLSFTIFFQRPLDLYYIRYYASSSILCILHCLLSYCSTQFSNLFPYVSIFYHYYMFVNFLHKLFLFINQI